MLVLYFNVLYGRLGDAYTRNLDRWRRSMSVLCDGIQALGCNKGFYWIIGRGSPRRSVRPRKLLPRGASSRSPVPARLPPLTPSSRRASAENIILPRCVGAGCGPKEEGRFTLGRRPPRKTTHRIPRVRSGRWRSYGGIHGEFGEAAIMGSDVSGASNSAQKWKAEGPRSRCQPDPGRYTPSVSQSWEEVATPLHVPK